MSRHITKEDYWKIKIGDKLMIRRDIDPSDNFDGNSFLAEMATEEKITVVSELYDSGVMTDFSYGKYTYDMIQAVYRNDKLIFGDDQAYISHNDFINRLKSQGLEPTETDLRISLGHVTDLEFSNIAIGDEIVVRVRLKNSSRHDGIRFSREMYNYNEDRHEYTKLTVNEIFDYGSKKGIRVNENDYSYSQPMIEAIVKK